MTNVNFDILNSRRARWGLIVVAWTLNGLLFSSQLYTGASGSKDPLTFASSMIWGMSYCYMWALITPLVLRLARKYSLEVRRLIVSVPVHVVISLLVAFVLRFISDIIRAKFVYHMAELNWSRIFAWSYLQFDYGLFMYWFIILINFAFASYKRYREGELRTAQLQTELMEAQLQALKTQLHPHFLFNTLNAISVLIQKSPDSAVKMLTRLSDLLRITLDNGGVQEVALKDELDFLDRYIQIQQVRFGDRLEVKMEINSNALNAKVPNLILQPLVENAIEHGVAKRSGLGSIRISAKRTDDRVTMEVRDNGSGMQNGNGKKDGVGLSNTRARLVQLYGEQQRFELTSPPEGGTVATVEIPFHSAS
jgi:sensor histidine kinase YesM